MPILAVDPGSRRVGLAISDEADRVALPLETLQRQGIGQVVRAVAEAAGTRGASEIVVGLPLDMDGTEGHAARRVRRFVSALEAEVDVPIVCRDERLTTVVAERGLSEAGVRGRARKQLVDQSAAAVLLQGYLDARRRRAGETEETWDGSESQSIVDAQVAARAGRRRRGR